ncbi:hypothetical protein [Halomonas sp.]|uniref:hypothetical protein n=1 Tax=Halomonas sp. TaxID=1486246 RepID=UPI00298E59DE|nr:hypothetical protein [Halomonas sp.]MDW7749097.1 hypothetical protein [Halomonas sp.]
MMAPNSPTPTLSRHTFSGMIADQLTALLTQYAKSGEPVTACELRDQLLKCPDFETADSNLLYLRARDRLRSLKHQGLAHRVGVQGKSRPVYKITDMPAEAISRPRAIAASPRRCNESDHNVSDHTHKAASETTGTTGDFATYLQRERHRLKLDMQAALGEATHYRQVLEAFPERRALIEPLHEAALQRGGELKGKLDAVVAIDNALNQKEVAS